MKQKEPKCKNDEMLTGYVNCTDCNNYQFIYGTLSYGTFYCVYCKLGIENGYLKKVTFKLYNYKGFFNLRNRKEPEDQNSIDDEKDNKIRSTKREFRFISMKASFSNKYDMYINRNSKTLRINMPITWSICKDYCEEYCFDTDPIDVTDLYYIHVNRELITIFKSKLTEEEIIAEFEKSDPEKVAKSRALNLNCGQSIMKVVP